MNYINAVMITNIRKLEPTTLQDVFEFSCLLAVKRLNHHNCAPSLRVFGEPRYQ